MSPNVTRDSATRFNMLGNAIAENQVPRLEREREAEPQSTRAPWSARRTAG